MARLTEGGTTGRPGIAWIRPSPQRKQPGASWTDIGRAVGISRQAARER